MSFSSILLLILLIILAGYSALLIRRSHEQIPNKLASLADSFPALIWAEDNNLILWSNSKYRELIEKYNTDHLSIRHFKFEGELLLYGGSVSATLMLEGMSDPLDFEITLCEFEGTQYHVALLAYATITAKKERKRFVENVSETFANSPFGIAVFDKRRDLTMFNPALAGLLDLSPSWLAGAPSLKDFLEELRNKGALPEPRDFKRWRDDLIDIGNNTTQKSYEEDWNMPDGRVFGVSAHPHSNAAITLYVEDITSRIAVEREYRTHLDNLYNAFDAQHSAVIMFERSGEMAFANQAFDEMWGHKFASSLVVPDIISISKIWSEVCMPSPIFGDLRDFVFQLENREQWTAKLMTKKGGAIDATFTPLPNGQTFCEFTDVEPNLKKQKRPIKTKQRAKA